MSGFGKRLIFLAVCAAMLYGAAARGEDGVVDAYRRTRASTRADKLFHEGKYDGARAGYMRAKDMTRESSDDGFRLHYNIGDTFYKQGNYEDAEKEFSRAALSDDPGLREAASYNLGNVYFKQGMRDSKVELLEKAVEHYQKALSINPDDEDAKFNIEVVRRQIKLKKQQQPRGGQPQNNQQQGQQKQEQQGQQQQGRQQKQPGQNQQGKERKDQDKEQQAGVQEGSTAEKKDQEQKQPAGSEKAPGKISKDEAERLLQAVQQNEQEDLKKYIESYQGGPNGKKDW